MILDVVYNHFGAEGNTARWIPTRRTSPTSTRPSWTALINYDDAQCRPGPRVGAAVGRGHGSSDFGVDGLRLDAIHAIVDSSAEHIVHAVARRVHALDRHASWLSPRAGSTIPRVMRSVRPRWLWLRRRLGRRFPPCTAHPHHRRARRLLRRVREGRPTRQGLSPPARARRELLRVRQRRFGAPAEDIAARRFVVFCQDHDQVGNRAFGDRLPAAARPLAAFCVLLSPFTPMLFMGEEYGENAPFEFFSDHIDKRIADARHARADAQRVRRVRLIPARGPRPRRTPGPSRRPKLTREVGLGPPVRRAVASPARDPERSTGRDRLRRGCALVARTTRRLRARLQLR